jgi:DNA-binding IclR family transcriptional regulator
MLSGGRPTDLIQSVSRALRILEEVGDSPEGLNTKQIAQQCDIALPTTYHLVRTLAYEGYLIRRSNGVYGLGLEIASRFRDLVASMQRPPQIHELLRQLAEVTGHTAYFAQLVDGRVVLTDQGQLLHEINLSARMGVFTEEEQYRPDVCCAAVLLDQGRQGAIGLSSEAGRWPQLGRALVHQLATRAGDVA